MRFGGARHERWDRGAALILAVLRRYFGPGIIPASADEPAPAPAALVASAPDLLLQDLETRRSAGVVATALAGGAAAFTSRISGGRIGDGPRRNYEPAGRSRQGFAAWAAPRLQRTLAELARKSVRDQATNLTALSRWLGT